MPSFSEGDMVVVTSYNGVTDGEYAGKVGPIKKIVTLNDGTVNYFVDINEPGFFIWDLICYEGEFEHVKDNNDPSGSDQRTDQ